MLKLSKYNLKGVSNMKLRRLQYEGFKTLSPVVIDTEKPVYVIGSNRSGKSGVIEMAIALATGGVDAPVGSESDLFRFSPTGAIHDQGQFQNGDGAWTVERFWNANKSPQKEIHLNGKKVDLKDGEKALARLSAFTPGLGFRKLYDLSKPERKRWLLSLFAPDETTVADMVGKFSDRFLHAVEAIPEEDIIKTEIAKRRNALAMACKLGDQVTDSPFKHLEWIETTLRDEKNKAVAAARSKVKAVQEIMKSAAMTTRPVAGGANGIRAKIAELEARRDLLKDQIATLHASLESHQALYSQRDEAIEAIEQAEGSATIPDEIADVEQEIEQLQARIAELGDAAGRLRELETTIATVEVRRDADRDKADYRASIEQSIRDAEEQHARLEKNLVQPSEIAAKRTELDRVEAELQNARDAALMLAKAKDERADVLAQMNVTIAALAALSAGKCQACGAEGDFTARIAELKKTLQETEQNMTALGAVIDENAPIAAKVDGLVKRVSDAAAEISGLNDRNANLREGMDREEKRIATLREQLAAIGPVEDLDPAIDRLSAAIETERSLVTEIDTLKSMLAEQEQDLAVLRADQGHDAARIAELRATKDRLEAQIQALPDLNTEPIETELQTVEDELRAKRESLETQIEREKAEKDQLRFNAEKTIEEGWAKIAGDMMEYVGPKGLMRELLEAAIKPLVADVTDLLQRAGFAGCRFAVRFVKGEETDTCDIGVQRIDAYISEINGDPNRGFIDYSAMSASEQLVFAACVAMGLAPRAKADWKPLFVKDLTLLVGEYRQLFVDLLTAEAGRFDNVFIEEAVAVPGVSSVRVDPDLWTVVDMEPYNQWATE